MRPPRKKTGYLQCLHLYGRDDSVMPTYSSRSKFPKADFSQSDSKISSPPPMARPYNAGGVH
jgi:hypothetical protein